MDPLEHLQALEQRLEMAESDRAKLHEQNKILYKRQQLLHREQKLQNEKIFRLRQHLQAKPSKQGDRWRWAGVGLCIVAAILILPWQINMNGRRYTSQGVPAQEATALISAIAAAYTLVKGRDLDEKSARDEQ